MSKGVNLFFLKKEHKNKKMDSANTVIKIVKVDFIFLIIHCWV